jgi:glycine/D-amino acid oxidase-like deaminating enzyme
MLPIEKSCFWLATHPSTLCQPLHHDEEADVVVIGAGLTGLWTALHLHELDPSRQVIVLEKEIAAYGASGRNAGMLSETIDHTHALAIDHFGVDAASTLARLGQDNVDAMIHYLAQHDIDCDYEPTGRLQVALTESQLSDCRHTVATAERLGVTNHRLLSQREVRGEIDSPLYLGGVMVAGGGILNPVKLVDGLKQEAIRRGIKVCEQTPVTDVARRSTGGISIKAGARTVKAPRGVLATNAYSHHLFPRLLRRFIPLYDYILVSEPLEPSQLETIGWRNRAGVTDGRTFFNYYRLTRDNRILWGTSEATYYRGNEVSPDRDHSDRHYDGLRASFRRHFPALEAVEFPYAWGGPIAATTRMTPFFGSLLEGRLVYGLGYTGHGLGSTHLAGKILAHLALDRHPPITSLPFVRKKPFPYPPEPFRHLAVASVTRALRKVDEGGASSLLLHLLHGMGIGFSS